MKSGTIARVVIYGLTVVVLLGLLVPIVSGVYSEEAQTGMGIPSVYELDEVTPDTLSGNIDLAVNGQTGYEIAYGDKRESVDPNGLDSLSYRIMASGADRATLYDPEGEVATQQLIVYSNSVYQTQITGIMMPGLEGMPMNIGVAFGMMAPDGEVAFRCNSETIVNEQGIILKSQLPTLPVIASSAAGYKMCIESSGGVDKIFDMDLTLNMSAGEKIGYDITSLNGLTVMTFHTDMGGNATGTMGDMKLTSSIKEGFTIQSDDGKVSAHLTELAEKGPVKITMGDESYTMSSEDAKGLAEIFKSLEEVHA